MPNTEGSTPRPDSSAVEDGSPLNTSVHPSSHPEPNALPEYLTAAGVLVGAVSAGAALQERRLNAATGLGLLLGAALVGLGVKGLEDRPK
ncbi:MAG: hypothetical protein K1X83_03960 [Oligoflexia bacterium]|nr:hypothetical protein [Oligoflexia bacterium]